MNHLVFEIGTALAIVALGSIFAYRLKLSVIPILIVLGMATGLVNVNFGVIHVESVDIIQFLGRIGILFLLFSLGLEFSVEKLIIRVKASLLVEVYMSQSIFC